MDSTQPYGLDNPARIGRFPVLENIGQGGFGAVYLAYDPRMGTAVTAKVAIKVLLDSRQDYRERFRQEAQLMRQLDGPGIVTVYEVGEHRDPDTGVELPYFVMEYCERGTLADRLHALGRGLTLEEGAGLIEAIAASARTLAIPRPGHPHGIVHRDLKPTNFLLRRVEDRDRPSVGDLLEADEQLILADFSIAKSTQPQATGLTLAGGTPAWGAPEQFYRDDTAGDALPPRSDVDATADVFAASAVVVSAISNSVRVDAGHYTDADFAATGPLEIELRRGLSRESGPRHPDFDDWRDSLIGAYRRFRRNRRVAQIAVGGLALIAVIAALGWYRDRDDGASEAAAPAAASTSSTTTTVTPTTAPPATQSTSVPGTTSTTATSSSSTTTSAPLTFDDQIVGIGGLCLDVPNQNARDGQNLWMWACNGTPAQRWTIEGERIMVMGRCLDIEGPVSTEGANLQIWECQDVPQHRWRTTSAGEIVSEWTGLCVAVAFGDTNPGAALETAVCDGSEAQRWQLP